MADYLPLGTRVIFDRTNVLVRREATEAIPVSWGGPGYTVDHKVKRYMRSIDTPDRIMTEENTGLVNGIIIGVRTVASGWVDGGYDEPLEFQPVEHHRVYQVAYDLHRKPALLFTDDVTPEVSRA